MRTMKRSDNCATSSCSQLFIHAKHSDTTMKFNGPKSPSRQRPPRAFSKATTRQLHNRGDDEGSQDMNEIARRRDSYHSKSQLSHQDTSFQRRNLRGWTAQENSDESALDSNTISREVDGRRESDYMQRESPMSTRGTTTPSSDDDSGKNSPDSGDAYKTKSTSKVVNREGHRNHRHGRMQSHWQQFSELYEDVFSGRSGSKSHSSYESSSSYSTSSDDDDFQLNANCMNALFSKDAERASNLIRCDKAGPSATEVQLKMTLPLPLQLMDGFDNLVPTKREFRSAINNLRIHSDKIAKNCDFDYNRLDEQVIDEEFAGYSMPQFYKSLFEAPTEASSDGEESSGQPPFTRGVSNNPKESAFVTRCRGIKGVPLKEEEHTSAEAVVRPGSLPSHVLIDEGGSGASSHESLGMMSFGMKKPHDARQSSRTIPVETPGDRYNEKTCDKKHSTIGPSENGLGRNGIIENTFSSSLQPSMREVITGRGITKESQMNPASLPARGKRLLSPEASCDSMQENPSFDEGHRSQKNESETTHKQNSERNNQHKEKNALSKFGTGFRMNAMPKKDWISAKIEQLDLVDQTYPSFEAPDDELPKGNREIQQQRMVEGRDGTHSLVDGIPASVDYGKKLSDKDIRTVYSDLTVDEEAFGKVEYPIVQTVSLSDRSIDDAELKIHPLQSRSSKKVSPSVTPIQILPEITSMSSGDELMGHRQKKESLAKSDGMSDLKDASTMEKLLHVRQTSATPQFEPEEGPLDEVIEGGKSCDPSTDYSKRERNVSSTHWHTESHCPTRRTSFQNPHQGPEQQMLHQHGDKSGSQSVGTTEATSSIPKTTVPSIQEACIHRCISAEVPMDEPRAGSLTSAHFVDTDVPLDELAQENPSDLTNFPLLHSESITGDHDKDRVANLSHVSKSGDDVGSNERSDESPQTLVAHEITNGTSILKDDENTNDDLDEALSPADFSTRLKSAAAARLEAMNGMPALNLNIKNDMTTSPLSLEEEETSGSKLVSCAGDDKHEFVNQSNTCVNAPSDDKVSATSQSIKNVVLNDDLTSINERNCSETITEDTVDFKEGNDAASCELNIGVTEVSQQNTDTTERNQYNDESGQDCEVFVDAADLEDFTEESDYGTLETDFDDQRIHFMSEIDARSQAVEINYIGDPNGNNDSHSLATEPPLVIAPTTTTLETSLMSSHTMVTVDTPVLAPPSRTFDLYERGVWNNLPEKNVSGSNDNFYYSEDCHDGEQEYQFDERYAKLSALLPASITRKEQTRDLVSFNLIHFVANGVTAIILLALAWLRHILGRQQTSSPRAVERVEGEPKFRGYVAAPDVPPTSIQKIQGNRTFHHGIQQMEREAGTFVEFVVPDIHGSGKAQHDQPIWRVNSTSQSCRKSQKINETYSAIRQNFSRSDARSVASVASMKGWSAKPDLCYNEFQEE